MARYVTDITLFGQIEVEAASQEEARAHFRRVMGLSQGVPPEMTLTCALANHPVEVVGAEPSIGMIATRMEEAA